MHTRTEIIATTVHYLATVCLLFAAVIHTFPTMLARWDTFIMRFPDAHVLIGMFGFFIGVLNLLFLLRKMYNS